MTSLESQNKTWDQRYDEYRALWRSKGAKAIKLEIKSMRAYLQRYSDGFRQICAPDELSDGDRLMALRDLDREMIKGNTK